MTLIPQNEPLHEMNAQDCTSDMHCVTDTHHMKALGAFGRVLHHGYGGRGRHYGSIQLVWHAQPPVLISQNGPLHEMNAQDCTSDMHCVTESHHMKALDALGRVLHHGYGGRGCHFVIFLFSVFGCIYLFYCIFLVLGLGAFLQISSIFS